MNKTILITLNKIIFHIEEDAYEILKNYLDAIKEHFSANGDALEILTDMESSIAEKFLEKYPDKEHIIAKADVEELIKVMGTVDDIDKETETKFKSEEKAPASNNKLKKLYRNPDDVIIAGVCSGLAAYFGIDPIIIRVLFIVTIFFGGTGIIAYLILWVVMPEAKTSAQKLEMQGDPVTLKKIEENIREKLKTDSQIETKAKKVINVPIKILGVFVNFLKSFGRYFLIFLCSLIGLTIVVGMITSIFALTFAVAVLLFNIDSSYLMTGLPLDQLVQIKNIITFTPYNIVIIAIYIITVVPLIFLLNLGLTLTKRKNAFHALASGLMVGLWMIAIIVLGVLSVNVYPQIQNQIDDYNKNYYTQAKTIGFDYQNFNGIEVGNTYELNIQAGDNYQITAIGNDSDLNNLEIKLADQNLVIKNKNPLAFCFFCFTHPVKINLTMPELKLLDLSGASKATVAGFNSKDLRIKLSGASYADLNLTSEKISLGLSGASKIILNGNAENLEAEASGASRISALGLPVRYATLDLSGASFAEVNSSDSLEVNASGASKVDYYGNPKVISDLSGASQVNKR